MNTVSYKELDVKDGWVINMSDNDVTLIVFVAYCVDNHKATVNIQEIQQHISKRFNRKFKANSLVDWYTITTFFKNRVNGMNSRFWFAVTDNGLVEIEFDRQSEVTYL